MEKQTESADSSLNHGEHISDHTAPNPWWIAWREARILLLAIIAIVTTYMLFAVDAPRLAYQRRTRDTGADVTVTIKKTDSPGVQPLPVDTPKIVPPVDTIVKPVPIDTSGLGAIRDSAARAREKQRIIDSTHRAKVAEALRLEEERIRRMNEQGVRSTVVQQLQAATNIGTDLAKKVYDLKDPNIVWFDARPEHEYDAGHIPGAINFYGEHWRSKVPELIPFMKKQIVIYCGGGDCTLSHELEEGLRSIGFKNVAVYTGGTKEWTAKNYPMTK